MPNGPAGSEDFVVWLASVLAVLVSLVGSVVLVGLLLSSWLWGWPS